MDGMRENQSGALVPLPATDFRAIYKALTKLSSKEMAKTRVAGLMEEYKEVNRVTGAMAAAAEGDAADDDDDGGGGSRGGGRGGGGGGGGGGGVILSDVDVTAALDMAGAREAKRVRMLRANRMTFSRTDRADSAVYSVVPNSKESEFKAHSKRGSFWVSGFGDDGGVGGSDLGNPAILLEWCEWLSVHARAKRGGTCADCPKNVVCSSRRNNTTISSSNSITPRAPRPSGGIHLRRRHGRGLERRRGR